MSNCKPQMKETCKIWNRINTKKLYFSPLYSNYINQRWRKKLKGSREWNPTYKRAKWKWSRSVVSNSVRPHGLQPTRLLRPWDSPGKSTGVGCHCLLQFMKVKSESEVAQSCPTLSDTMDCSPPGSSVHGILQARGLEWGAIAFPGDLPNPGIEPCLLHCRQTLYCLSHQGSQKSK